MLPEIALIGGMALAAQSWWTRSQADTSDELLTRLEEVQSSIDALRAEVERISEAQQFTAPLLAEPPASLPDADASKP
jgi:hypothetical protein